MSGSEGVPADHEPARIRVLAICVFRHGRRILVARGRDDTKGEHFLRPVGGEVEFGERAEEALRREVHEELGLDIGGVIRLGVLENTFTYDGTPGHEVVFVFDASFEDRTVYDRSEIPLREAVWDGAARWIDLDALPPEPLYPDGLLELVDAAR